MRELFDAISQKLQTDYYFMYDFFRFWATTVAPEKNWNDMTQQRSLWVEKSIWLICAGLKKTNVYIYMYIDISSPLRYLICLELQLQSQPTFPSTMNLSFAGTDAGGEGDHICFEKFCPHHLYDHSESNHKVPLDDEDWWMKNWRKFKFCFLKVCKMRTTEHAKAINHCAFTVSIATKSQIISRRLKKVWSMNGEKHWKIHINSCISHSSSILLSNYDIQPLSSHLHASLHSVPAAAVWPRSTELTVQKH